MKLPFSHAAPHAIFRSDCVAYVWKKHVLRFESLAGLTPSMGTALETCKFNEEHGTAFKADPPTRDEIGKRLIDSFT